MRSVQVRLLNLRKSPRAGRRLTWAASLLGGLLAAGPCPAVTRYVWTNSPAPTPPHTNWTTAAHTIQDAIDVAVAGDTVLVTNGVYATGGRVVYGSMTNRVAITKAITVRSVNGPAFTAIRGAQVPASTNGSAAVRCVYVGTNALLSGFTLTNGATRTSGNILREQCGGGAWCVTNAVVSNCLIAGNAAMYGGGTYDGRVFNSVYTGNLARDDGGGAVYGRLVDCTLHGNVAEGLGGGADAATLISCQVSSNQAFSGGGAAEGVSISCVFIGNRARGMGEGGGIYLNEASNCVLVGNGSLSVTVDGGGAARSTLVNCLLAGNATDGDGAGSCHSTLVNCTVAGNVSGQFACGSYFDTLRNCIVYSNAIKPSSSESGEGTYLFGFDVYGSSGDYNCTPTLTNGVGNITNPPVFANPAAGNYRLAPTSPCRNAGGNTYASGPTDLDGTARILGGTVDIGAYEFERYHSWAAAITNGLDEYADDADGDGHANLLEYATGGDPARSDPWAGLRIGRTNQATAVYFHRNTNATDVIIVLERAGTLGGHPTWSGLATNIGGSWGGSTNVTETGAGSPRPVTVRDASGANGFLRLRVLRP